MRRASLPLVALLVLCAPPGRTEGARATLPNPPADPLAALGKCGATPPPSPLARDDRGYDCLDLGLTLDLDFDHRILRGSAAHRVEATRPLDILDLDFTDSLEVLAVWRGAVPARFTHAGNHILVTLDPPVATGDSTEIIVAYAGRPPRTGLLGFAFQRRNGVPAAYTLSEPNGSPSWWPCKDVPDDKFTATVVLTIPDTLYAGSNGRLVADTSANGRRRMEWREGYPIAPYLVSVACTNYAVWEDAAVLEGGRVMPVLYLAYPEDRIDAEGSWERTPQMIQAFEERFGPYPFGDEKYGMAEFSWGGAMEHQTLTSYGEYAVDGTDMSDWIVAHELGHQWWGDKVTLASWEHMWLNEGFARYSEAVWFESVGGIEAYRTWIRGMWRDDFPGAIVPPDYLFNSTVYLKGAWILHMLRGLLGEETLFEALRVYGDRFAYANAATGDLIAVLEEVSGKELDWFFDRWVYGTGMPFYDVFWSLGSGPSGPTLVVRVEQIQDEPVFSMPAEIEVWDRIGAYRFQVTDSLRAQTFELPVRMPPDSVRFDPDDWILKTVRINAGPAGVAGTAIEGARHSPYPNPGHPPFVLPVGGDGASVAIVDAAGRVLRTLAAGAGAPVVWDGTDADGRPAAPGVVFVAVRAGGRTVSTGRLTILR